MAKSKPRKPKVNKTALVKTNTTIKTFQYSKGTVSLSFNLNLDEKKGVRDFKALLEQALKDVNEVLE